MFKKITSSVFLVGGAELSDGADCLVYAVDLGDVALIDCGAGPGWPRIRDNLFEAGLDPARITTLILTHAHVDHIGAAHLVKNETGCRIAAHELDLPAIESGDPAYTAASWYGMDLPGVEVDHPFHGERETLPFPSGRLDILHTPGHTPGSVAVLLEEQGQKVLFGQDIHGPFDPAFRSDLAAWRRSMQMLLDLDADILCEGHFGVYRSKVSVRRFIEGHLAAHRPAESK